MYFLQKAFSKGKAHQLKKYVVCPGCHSIYPLSDYSLKSLKEESPSCTYRKKHKACKELLFRKVKVGSNYKLMPKRIYVYIPIKRSLLKLLIREDFLKKCEMWRASDHVPNTLMDVYDSALWKDFMLVDGKPFLKDPYNSSFKLNID